MATRFITKNHKKIPIGNKKGALPKTNLTSGEESNLSTKEHFIERGMPSNVAEAQNARNSTRGSGIALDPPEIILRDRKIKALDEEDIPVLEEERLDDIMEPIGNADTGEINFNKLEKAVEENVMEILKREKLPTDITVHFQEVREETGQDEFKRTGEGESGHYQYMFNIYKNKDLKVEDIIYRGVAYGSIQAGEMLDMEVDVFNH